jgi:hypothetical protein
VRFRATLQSPSRVADAAPFDMALQARFGARRRRKTPNRKKVHFAMRNETFRGARRKSLKSLRAPIQRFRGFVCFQGFNGHFVSPFSLVIRFQ